MEVTMKIFLIRHGEDDERYKGGWNRLPLISRGKRQVSKLANYLEKRQKDFKIEKIISSDIVRTRQTAKIINNKLHLPIEYTRKLREMNNGVLAGMKVKDAIKQYPGVYFRALKMNERYPGGESPIEFRERVIKSFNELVEENKEHETIAFVTHNGVINVICSHITGKIWTNRVRNFKADYASLTIINITEDSKEVELTNFKAR
jgi:phosphoglycerate mutase